MQYTCHKGKKKRDKVVNPGRNKNSFSTRALRYFQDVNIPLEANFWNQLKFRQGDIWKTMGQTTLKQVLAESRGTRGKGFVTKEMCIESARKYRTLKEWRNSPEQYHQNLANQKRYAKVKTKLAARLKRVLVKTKDPRAIGKGDELDNYACKYQECL